MCDCAEELERRSSRPIPALQSEASSLCSCSGILGSLPRMPASLPRMPAAGGWAKSWVPIIGTATLTLFALYYKFKDKIKAMLWDVDPCAGFITKAKPVPPKKIDNCDCD